MQVHQKLLLSCALAGCGAPASDDDAATPSDLSFMQPPPDSPGGGPCSSVMCSGLTRFCNQSGHCVGCLRDTDCAMGTYCKIISDAVASCTPGCQADNNCAPAQKCCGNQCIDPLTDAKNCGGCGMACSGDHASATCAAGSCAPGKCEPGWGDCNMDPKDGCEANLHADVANCTMCGAACTIPNAYAGCADGCYATACKWGFDDCNNNMMDGCETSVLADKNNCGACGKSCAALANAVAGCVSGNCVLASCSQGYADCNNNANDGCEVKTTTDLNNCGKCGNVCPMGNVCVGGGCTCPNCNIPNASAKCVNNMCVFDKCNPGFGNCDNNTANGCEVDTSRDPNNCGACGNVCPQNAPLCANSACGVVPPCGGYVALNGCWYIGPVGTTCAQTCQNHGGYDAVTSTHMGNPICTHFFPNKANGTNWVQIECCSIDNNTNWGATGMAPDPNWSHPACNVACSCKN
jgi:hypothetical protein